MAALTNSQRLRESRRKREEEEKKSSSQSASGNYKNSEKLEKRRLERNIGLDTFESDLKSVGNSISNVYSGWQTQETMLNTRKSVEEMHKRLGDYQTYQSKFGGNDLSDVVSGYQSVLDEWDNLSSTYGTYQNADAFNNARKKAQFDKQFSVTNADGTVRGLTYDEVQSKLKEYEKGSDEHNYLSQYMGYSDLRDFDKAIKNTKNDSSFLKELETKRNQYALDNKFDLYKDYMNAEDFEEKSQYSSTKMDNAWKKLTSTYSMGYGDLTYEYINNVDGVRDEIERKASIYGQDTGEFSSSNEKKGYDKLNEDEVAVYNYLYQTEGKDKAQEFLDDMEIVLTKRVYDEATQRWEDAADSGAVASTIMSALSVPANIFGAAYTAGDTLRDAIQGKEYNPYGYYKTPSNFAADTRGYVSENIAEATEGMELFGQNVPSFLYQTGMSVADTAVGSQMFGNGFTAVMGVSAAQQKAKELKEAGASSEEVARGAVGSGLIEMVFEKISIDNLLKAKNPDSFLKILKETAKQSGIEGSEEFFTETANVIFDNLNRGDMSDTYQKYEDYLERGFTKEEAERKVKQELNAQIGWAFVGGAISGTALGSASTVAQYHDLSQTGSTIRENQTMDDLKNVASGMNNDSYQKYLELIDSGKISDAKLGNFFTQVEADTMGNVETERNSAVMREIANKVNEMGDSKNSGMIASAITKKLNGENLSDQEKAVLKTDTAKTVISDIKNGEYDFKNIINTSDSVVDASMKHSKVMSTYTTSKTKEELAIKERAKELANVDEAKVGEEVDNIEGIRIEDGVATLLTSQGEVLADNAILSAQKAELVAYAETMGNEKGNLFYSQYDGNTDVETYRNAFNLAYSYGESQLGMATAQQNIKSLNTSQLSEIYRAGRMERVKVRQKEINAIKNKYAAKHFYKGNVNDSIIDYTNSGKGEVNWDDLSEGQKENVELAKALYTGLGVNVRFTTEGTKKKYNGYYNPAKNEVVIDLYAGTNIGNVKDRNLALVTTSAHELTHWMEKLSPEMFAKIKDHVFETLHKSDGITDADRIDAEIGRILSEHPDMKTVSDEYAISEIVARACEDMLSMTDVGKEALSRLTESERKTFFEKAKEIIQDMIAYIDEILGRYKSKSAEAIALREYQDELKQLAKMWETAMKEAVEVNQSITEAAINGEKLVNGISKDGTTIVGENVLQMSEKTYNNGGREYLENWLKKKSSGKKAAISKEDAEDILRQTDAIYDIMQDIKENNELPDYARWAETDITTDENGKTISVIVKNGDYAMNLDVSLVCKKRTALNAVLNALVQSNDLSVYTLTETDVAELNAIIKEHEFEIACALCFVDSKRYRVGSWAESFCEGAVVEGVRKYGFNEMVRSLVPKGSDIKIDEFNFTNRDILNQPTDNLLKDADDSELDFTFIDKIMAENPPAANGAKTAQYRYAEAIKNNKDLRSILNPSEIISSIGLDAIRVEHTKLYGLINGHNGTNKPKFAHQAVAYANNILRAYSWNAKKAKYVGGVRLQSFSDFMANMVFDYVQMISELSAKKLTAHAYTKEPLFVKLFGQTGIKINMSLVPKVDLTAEQIERFKSMSKAKKEEDAEYQRLKETAGLKINENGEAEYVWEDETFPYDVAMDIMGDPRYTKNCGTIAVGISNAHIRKLLADDRISMVIPYHKSGLNHMVAEMRNIALYNDYTTAQNTRYKNGEKLNTKKHKDFNFYGDLYGVGKKKGSHDPKQTAQNYLDWCDKHDYLPRFDEFRDSPNYYKLLIDFSVYDINDGMKYTEHEAVKAVYPSAEEFKDLIVNGVQKNGVTYGGLKQSQGESTRLDKETQQIVDEFRNRLIEKHGEDVLGRQYSDRVTDEDTLDFLNEQIENGEYATVYRSFQIIDGGLYAPMNAVDRDENGKNKKLGYRSELGQWEMATESPEIAQRYMDTHPDAPYAKFDLDGVDNKTNAVAYNPYLHASNMVLNDQFSGAYRRNLVTVECRVPLSEIGAYRAKYAKDATGWADWKAGTVAGKLMKVKPEYTRKLFISRYMLPVRIIPDYEVAQMYKEYLDGTDISVPWNVVTPSLREELEKQGVNVSYNDVKFGTKVVGFNDVFGDRKTADIRYSDRDYMDAVNSGDIETAQKMVDEVANRVFANSAVRDNKGKLIKVYHGSPESFTVFKGKEIGGLGNYFSPWESFAQTYGDTHAYYVNLENPIVYDEDFEQINDVREADADGFIYIIDDIEGEIDQDHVGDTEIVVYDSRKIKSADPVTYDDKGNVIPLSKRFNEEDADIRFADRDTDDMDARTLLTNALESATQTEAEKDLLKEYREHILIIGIKESELSEITAQIKELSFSSGKRDTERLEYLKRRAEKIRGSINYFDKKLLKLEATSPLMEVVKREREKARKQAYEKNREYTKKALSSYKERMEQKAKIQSITQKAMTLNKWMLKNSKDEHIPETMKPVVAKLLQAIDFSSKQLLNKGVPTKTDISLTEALTSVQQMISDAKVDGEILYELYGSDLDADMKKLVESVHTYMRTVGDNAYVLNQMTLEELKTLDKMVGAIKTSVSQLNKFHVANTKKSVSALSQGDMIFMNSLGQAKLHKNKWASNISQLVNWGNATPYYAFRRFGEGGEVIYEALMDGWDKFAFHIRKIKDYSEATYTEEEVKKWSEEVKEFDILLPATKAEHSDPNFKGNYQKVQMTTAQIMALYCLQKREQAKSHIFKGGIRIADIVTKKDAISQGDGINLTEKELDKIINSLTDRQIEVADALQKFLNDDCTEWGNEISMKRFGYKAFGEENYFPIRSDENVTGTDEVKEKEKTLYRLLNLSFTKSVNENANNRIVVDSIFDVFAQHTSEMAKYNALALPVLDAVRWFNYKEKGKKVDGHFKTIGIKQSMENAYGKDSKNYVNTFLNDLNGSENVGRDKIAKGFMSNAKIASVGFNAKVVALQPTSFLRASAVIDNKYLIAGLGRKPKYAMAEKWCGMAQWKGLGFIDINVQRGVAELIKHDESAMDKLKEASMKGAEIADQITLGYLWNACEAEVKHTRSDLKVGSDEYYTAVGKRLRDIIYATQVVDSTMTRSHMMRSGDTKDKILTNFASEPTLSYNMLMDAYYSWKLTERQTGDKVKAFKQHGKKLARTMYAYTVTSAVTAALEAGFQIFRDDEEKDEEELLMMYLENLLSNMSVLNKIPYMKECIAILQGYTSSNLDMQWMQYFSYFAKGFEKLLKGEGNAYTTFKNGLKMISYTSGIPGYNLVRDINALLDKFGLVSMEELEEMFNDTIGDMFPSLKSK